MLRNDLIVLLSQQDNDTVTVDINGTPIDIEAVTNTPGGIGIALVLQPDDLQNALQRVVCARE
jgi:hypothetical protein